MDIIQILIQGVAVGIALAALYLLMKVVTNHSRHTDKVIDRNTDAWNEHTKSNQKLTDVIERWHLKESKKGRKK